MLVEATVDGPDLGVALAADGARGRQVGRRGQRRRSGDRATVTGQARRDARLVAGGPLPLRPASLAPAATARSSTRSTSYFGLRTVRIDGLAITLNGKPVFQRLVLDQGFYPDGIYTAPTDEALRRDIELSQAMGFNGARLHQKVFEPRFLYWADRLGYLVLGRVPDWGLDLARREALDRFLREWLEALERDYTHPSIVGWCPFNETNNRQNPEVLRAVYRATKALDPTRPVIDT